ncbi:autotransporter domain-containing protein [Reyranella sp.]|uniref:autotransporter domain-containing protein n=1 Tax=Reyranella sp. TaxID=1929291 RepID=UPI00272F8AD1|nr:autotransporter domain-containing protein [Reyranella sp.]MDP2378804.1 autotransporter domain-containing protein [Reyranella sp.]
MMLPRLVFGNGTLSIRTRATTMALLALFGAAFATAAVAQNFIPQGPAPSFGPFREIQSNDAPPNGTVGGAIQAVLPHPTDPNTMYVGGVNGGIWVTHNGGTSWTPLSDKERSLSIASLAFDPTDAARGTLIAGIGITSNGLVGDNRGGQQIGLLYSNNGGSSWTEIDGGVLAGKSIVGVAARGSTLLAAASEPHDAAAAGGLYRSVNGGTSFALVSGSAGLAAGPVSSLAGDTANQNVFYAAVTSTGVYRSGNGGADWNQVLTLDANRVARVATGASGAIAVGIYDSSKNNPTSGQLVAIQHSLDSGATWVTLGVPDINPGRQASTDFAIVLDPNNPNIVYVAGDRIASPPYTVTAFRVVRQGDASTIETLTDGGTSDGSTTHADARTLVFDALGRLIQGGDGGLYVRSNPQGVGAWSGLNGAGLSLREAYAVAYDSISRRLVVSAQDTGSAYQTTPGSERYASVGGGGDGVNAVVNDKTLRSQGQSVIYTTSQNLAPLERQIVDANGTVIASHTFGTRQGTTDIIGIETNDFSETPRRVPEPSLPFSTRLELNRIDPQKIAIGSHYVYTTTDTDGASETLTLTNLGTPGVRLGNVTAIAYGTRDNTNALIAGVGASDQVPGSSNGLYRSTTGTAGSLERLTAYSGDAPTSVVFDARSQTRFFAADANELWGTTTSGTAFTNLTSNFTSLGMLRPTGLEFISNNGVNALLVGGLNNIAGAASPIVVADSDAAGSLSDWRRFGVGLPNTIPNQIVYNDEADVLAIGLFGRGAWLLYDVTTFFPTATVLRFGAADNDSAPDAAILTGNRNLEKVGIGTLNIAGTTSYTGETLVNGGRLAANGSLLSSSGVTVGADGTLGGTGFVPSTMVMGALAPGNSIGTITVVGNLTFTAGSAYQVEVAGVANDRTNVTGTATLDGTTQATYSGTSFTRAPNTILSATGGLAGRFQNLTAQGLPSFLFANLGYGPTDVTISLQSGMASISGLGGNQGAVARAFDTAFNAGAGLNGMPGLYGLSAGQIPQALTVLSGESTSVTQTSAFAAGQQFASTMTGRAATRRSDELACAERTDQPAACEVPQWSAWTLAFGGTQSIFADAATGSAAAQQNVGGGAFGGDYRLDPDSLIGAAVGMSSSGYSVGTAGASGRATGIHAGIYGLHHLGAAYLSGAIAYGHFDNSTTRNITGIGATETAKGTFTGDQIAGRFEIGRLFEAGAIGITPFANLQPSQLWQSGYTESSTTMTGGPGTFPLTFQASSTTSLPLSLGAQFDARGAIDARPFSAFLRLAWVHEFLPNRNVTAGFVNLPGSLFTVDGARAASDAARIDLGAKYAVGAQTSLFVNAGAELSNRGESFSGTVGLRFMW